MLSWSDHRVKTTESTRVKRIKMKNQSALISFIIIIVCLIFTDHAAAKPSIEAYVYKDKKGNTMPYRILKPSNYNPNIKYPLILCLHGAGGRGKDNTSRGNEAFNFFSSVEAQKKYPAFILTPQCPANKQWVNTPWQKGSYSISKIPISTELKLVVEILSLVEKKFHIDSSKIYVTGQSMGGYATWDIIMRYPKKFAAAIPVCGAGDPAQAEKIKHIGIWAFHGHEDKTVPATASREIIKALEKQGGKIKYTEYTGVGHNSWKPAWKEKHIAPWLFQQHKQK